MGAGSKLSPCVGCSFRACLITAMALQKVSMLKTQERYQGSAFGHSKIGSSVDSAVCCEAVQVMLIQNHLFGQKLLGFRWDLL